MDYDIWPDDPQDAFRQSLKALHVHDKSELAMVCWAAGFCVGGLSHLREWSGLDEGPVSAGPRPAQDATLAHEHEHGLFCAGSRDIRLGFQLYGARLERTGEAPTFGEIVRMLPSKSHEVATVIKEWCKRPPRELVVWFIIRKTNAGVGRVCFLGATEWRSYVAQRPLIEAVMQHQGQMAIEAMTRLEA